MATDAVLAIDPGPAHSAWLILNPASMLPARFGIENNAKLLAMLREAAYWADCPPDMGLAVERIESYGMSVGQEVFDTCITIGRMLEAWRGPSALIGRKTVKMHLCNSMRAKDTNIRTALIDRYGGSRQAAVGTSRSKGPLYGVKTHVWAALAVAVTAIEAGVRYSYL